MDIFTLDAKTPIITLQLAIETNVKSRRFMSQSRIETNLHAVIAEDAKEQTLR
jgi:hypothetical protein